MKTREPPYTERYARWCERSEDLFKSSSYSIYATPDQLRQRAKLNMDNPPVISPITLKGLKQNKDGVYAMKDVQELLQRISDKADSQVK